MLRLKYFIFILMLNFLSFMSQGMTFPLASYTAKNIDAQKEMSQIKFSRQDSLGFLPHAKNLNKGNIEAFYGKYNLESFVKDKDGKELKKLLSIIDPEGLIIKSLQNKRGEYFLLGKAFGIISNARAKDFKKLYRSPSYLEKVQMKTKVELPAYGDTFESGGHIRFTKDLLAPLESYNGGWGFYLTLKTFQQILPLSYFENRFFSPEVNEEVKGRFQKHYGVPLNFLVGSNVAKTSNAKGVETLSLSFYLDLPDKSGVLVMGVLAASINPGTGMSRKTMETLEGKFANHIYQENLKYLFSKNRRYFQNH